MSDNLQTTSNLADLAGRVLLAAIFLIAGIGKIGGYAGTQAYMSSHGVPGALLPLVILTEIGGAVLVIAGLWTRWAALALAGFSILAAILFHGSTTDQQQITQLLKDFSMAGGFLLLAAKGAGAWSVDAQMHTRTGARRPA